MLKSYDNKFNMACFKSNSRLVYICEIFYFYFYFFYFDFLSHFVHKTTPSHFKSANAVTKDFLKKSRDNAPSKDTALALLK